MKNSWKNLFLKANYIGKLHLGTPDIDLRKESAEQSEHAEYQYKECDLDIVDKERVGLISHVLKMWVVGKIGKRREAEKGH